MPNSFPVDRSTATPSQANATWFPPVHVAPQRSDLRTSQPQQSPNQLYPGVFDPEPVAQPVGGRFTDAYEPVTNRAPGDRNVRRPTRAGTASALQSGESSQSGQVVAKRPIAAQPHQAAVNAGRPIPQRVMTRPVAYQEEASPRRMPSRRLDDVQPAFVAETGPGAIPPEPIEQPLVRIPRSDRGEGRGGAFTRAPANPVIDAGLSAEFDALEQPLNGFEDASNHQATPEGNWRSSGSSSQQPAQDLSVLDAPGNPAAWQSAPREQPLPARPAAAPRFNSPSLNSPNLPGEIGGFGAPSPSLPSPSADSSEINERESWQDFEALPRPQKTLSCDELRDKLLTEPLTDIALDVSPPLPDRGAIPTLPSGDWVDHNGQLLAQGQMVTLSRGYVIVDTAEGRRKISIARLGDSSLALVAQAWQLPGECAIGIGEYAGRCWTPQLSTWYASNLCHKPLYFEQVQLERYGHSAGPIMGPIRSSAHFFGSLVFWPYHTAIHPANECIYPLGYYRPGNCAPWLVEPFPFSAGGAIRQGGFITGAAFLF